MHFPLPHQAVSVLSKLEACGFEAYAVGGCVRDYILGIQPKEFDICSSATPEDVHTCFHDEKLLDTGLKHGTVTLLTEGHSFEITTFRKDSSYSDQRHPDSVTFTKSIYEDLKRRDFTVNAMAFSPFRGFVDPFDGVKACHDKQLIAVGEAMKRFGEDALRILRAIRFSSNLGFVIEHETEIAMFKQAQTLKKISRERVASEINRTLMGKAADCAFERYAHILLIVIPQLATLLESSTKATLMGDLWAYTLDVLRLTQPELPIRWAALLHKSGKPSLNSNAEPSHYPAISAELADHCLISLRQSKKLQLDVHQLILHHEECINEDNLQQWLSKLGLETLKNLLTFKKAITAARSYEFVKQTDDNPDLIRMAENLVNTGACLSLRDLKVNGDMLMQAGIPEGPVLGSVLLHLLNLVLTGQANNNQQELINLAIKDYKLFR